MIFEKAPHTIPHPGKNRSGAEVATGNKPAREGGTHVCLCSPSVLWNERESIQPTRTVDFVNHQGWGARTKGLSIASPAQVGF